jgi:hypothetical protein
MLFVSCIGQLSFAPVPYAAAAAAAVTFVCGKIWLCYVTKMET